MEDEVDLKVMRRIMGDTFGAGVQHVMKTGKDHILLAIAGILNVTPPIYIYI